MKSKNLAIIPARGGSKRIPRKNIKDFLGKPIIAYSIEAALKSELFDEVMVSTDDEEIAEIAKKYGAKVPFMRSKENADDYAGTADVLIEVINQYKTQNAKFDYVCCIYPTAPLIKQANLEIAYKMLIDNNLDSVFPIVKFSFPPQRVLKLENDNVYMVNEEYLKARSQDIEPIYHDAGQFYWVNTELMLAEKTLFSKNSNAIILTETEVQDIDNETDWKMAEMKYKLKNL